MNSIFARWISVHFIYGDPVICLFTLVYLLPLNIFYWVLLGFYGTLGDRTKLALNLHSWKTIYLKTIVLFLWSFWCKTFIFLSLRYAVVFRRAAKKLSDFFFWIRFTCVFRRGLRYTEESTKCFWIETFLTCFFFFFFNNFILTLNHKFNYVQ